MQESHNATRFRKLRQTAWTGGTPLGGRSRKLVLLACAIFLIGMEPARAATLPTLARPAASILHRKKHVKVWVNTETGIYHCPGTRWYGKTEHGKYMGECKARRKGYRPAYYRPCGSECKK